MVSLWQSLIGPAVVAALVSLIGLMLSIRTTRSIHKERIKVEERWFEKKINTDIDLAEKKFNYEIMAAERKRILDLVESVLADFYTVKEVIEWARNPGSFAGEGTTRARIAGEAEEERAYLDAYFVCVERMNKHNEVFSRLRLNKYRFQANFGQEAGKPFDLIAEVRAEITTASNMLIKLSRGDYHPKSKTAENIMELEGRIWSDDNDDDAINLKVGNAITAIESHCVPVLRRVLK